MIKLHAFRMVIMRTAFVLLLTVVCVLAVPVQKLHYKVADKAYLAKQIDLLLLFNYVNQPSYYKHFVEIADAFNFEGHWDQWSKPQYAKKFYQIYKQDILPQGEVFSIFYPKHLNQAVALFRTFYYAKDYQTFYNAAVWARHHVNQGMFVYALSVAIVHSPHAFDILLPPIHEIFPHYFFNDEVMYKAQQYKQHYWGTYTHEEKIIDADYKGYTIQANYSGYNMNLNSEQSMTYFTEDIGINSYYYYQHITSPFWLDEEEFAFDIATRGEYYYFHHQQLLARYYMERLSNGMGEIPHFEYNHPIETGYYPSLTYANGLHFPTRPNHASLYHHEQQIEVQDYERRIRDALDKGYVYTPEGQKVNLFDKKGFETLGRLVESNAQSPNGRFYGNLQLFARYILGYSNSPLNEYKVTPSALQHYETSIRDPMFWQMYKRIMSYFIQHQKYEGPYDKKAIYFPGVTVEDVQVDRLFTFFDYHYSDLSNGVTVDEKEFKEKFAQIRARQYRLNHKSFNYEINVTAEQQTEAFIKVFIGPKYDEYGREIDIKDNRLNFFEIDKFRHTLEAGQNTIVRNSNESQNFAKDQRTYQELYSRVIGLAIIFALNDGEEYKYYEPSSEYYYFPRRLMLPKGDFGGRTYQFYIFISPYHTPTKHSSTLENMVPAEYSMGYPLDRPIEFEHDFFVPNSYFKDVVIYHENSEDEINTN